jgi:hypothetical protein
VTPISKLRQAWKELQTARKCVELAVKNKHDAALVNGHCGFALEHLDNAMKLVKEVGQELKPKR